MRLSETCFCDAAFTAEADTPDDCAQAVAVWRERHDTKCPGRRLRGAHGSSNTHYDFGFTADTTPDPTVIRANTIRSTGPQ